MGAALGEVLPLAIGIAISPLPIIAVILMLLSPQAARNAVGFLTGWVAGVVVVTTVVLLLVGQSSDTAKGEPSTLSGVLKVVFGALLVLFAVRQWRSRPRAGEPAAMPRWMSAIQSLTIVRSVGLGALLGGINPKNLLLCLSAGTTVGAAHLSAGGNFVVMVVFTVLASSTVAVPVVGYLVAQDRMREPLKELRGWLAQNSAVVMAVVLIVLGVVVLGKGIGTLSA